MQTSTPPAPPPARPAQLPVRIPTRSKNKIPPAKSHARRADRQRKNAKPHPTAAGETQKSSPPPAENKLPSTRPAPRQTKPGRRQATPQTRVRPRRSPSPRRGSRMTLAASFQATPDAERSRSRGSSVSRAMTRRWIWAVPSYSWRILASRISFSTLYSLMKP